MVNFSHVTPQEYLNSKIPELIYRNGASFYQVNGERFPRISEVLNLLNSEGLQAWRKRVGDKVADMKCQIGIKRGKDVHAIIQAYLDNSCTCQFSDLLLANAMVDSAKPTLNRISKIRGTELPLFSHRLNVCGTADCIADFDGIASVIDFKTSEKPKRYEWCKRYFIQETFYSIAWEDMTNQPIEQLVTIIISENGEIQVLKEKRDDWILQLEELVREFDYRKTVGVRK